MKYFLVLYVTLFSISTFSQGSKKECYQNCEEGCWQFSCTMILGDESSIQLMTGAEFREKVENLIDSTSVDSTKKCYGFDMQLGNEDFLVAVVNRPELIEQLYGTGGGTILAEVYSSQCEKFNKRKAKRIYHELMKMYDEIIRITEG